jgi:hypothetical protein
MKAAGIGDVRLAVCIARNLAATAIGKGEDKA